MFLSLKSIELSGFKSFGKKTELLFGSPITAVVGPNGSGKSNVAEAFRFVLGGQSMKSMRRKRGEALIGGGSPALPRMNRAGAKVVFDNSKRLLDLDFKEVTVERVVYRDGQNEYLLNGSQVRLKDVIRLLAGANIGGSGYQIISQGEADRILNATPRERREMVEDALGLKLYHNKKNESDRKLAETGVNIDKTKSLRRELAPHLNFLRTQVEKIEKAREMKDELAVKLNEYLARENAWITQEDARLLHEVRAQESELKQLGGRVAEARGKRSGSAEHVIAELQAKVGERDAKLSEARRESEQLTRELGRAERENDISVIKGRLSQIRERIKAFVEGLSGAAPETNEEVRQQVEALAKSLERVRTQEAALAGELETLRKKIAEAREAGFIAERDLMEVESSVREAQGKLGSVQAARANIAALRQRFEEEVREGIALIGAAVHGWEKSQIPEGALLEQDRRAQEKRHREIERLKIKIEESGIGGGDAVVREFNQTKEREKSLARELADLEASAQKLKDIIAELEKTIDARFTEGIKHINVALQGFFAKLFGGGHAKLEVEEPRKLARRRLDIDNDDEDVGEVTEEEELYAGLSIDVSLPRKKIRGLDVLSGGERALTSIALIFSMSQVNPPPFLILDETDAALDEANSRRYGDMVENLAKKAQLIVITHNRATMSAAGELYGVTMGQDGISKLLSVRFEEATKVAK